MDMSQVIVPRSDQINADDLQVGPMTIKINAVKVSPGTEQPVSIYFDGSEKAYRCCKSMARVLVSAWGADSLKYVGRSLTLYCDPKVKWGGLEVGGIRISHMSDIEAPITLALTATKGSRKPFTVRPLVKPKESAAPQAPTTTDSTSSPADAADHITPEQIATIETLCLDNDIALGRLKAAVKVDQLSAIPQSAYDKVLGWIDRAVSAKAAA